MKITNHAVQQENTTFGKLSVGDVFQDTDADEGKFWIKMPVSYESNDYDTSEKYNAYDIYHNSYGYFYDNELVIPLNAELIITRK